MSLKALKKAVNRKQKDTFALGTVIRWEANGYTYAALKTGAAWVTTARPGNPFVKSIYPDFEDLLEVLGRAEVTEVWISDSWLQVNDDDDEPKPRHPVETVKRMHFDPPITVEDAFFPEPKHPLIGLYDGEGKAEKFNSGYSRGPMHDPADDDGDVGFGGNGEHV
jgi:hypothetical protein